MAVAIAAYGSYVPSKFHNPPLTITSRIAPPQLPLYISTDSSHVNPRHLHELYALCNHSCHRFPNFDSHGRVEPVDAGKLRTALEHSSVVVSVFTKPEFISDSPSGAEPESRSTGIGGEWIQRVIMPVTPENGRLVGFGRAVSDLGLTASVHDVMVIPGLRRRGIGRMIVQKISRMLTRMEVYDISALCNDQERLFFTACGFGDDILNSTTMMYTGTSNREKEMGKIRVEVCLISARGLRRASSLWKLQWFAVGWIDSSNKYCTRIDASGNANPVWKTKFSALIDPSEPGFQDMAIHIEVYSREPVFLRERLLGTATVVLKEFLEKFLKSSEGPKPVEEMGSFQLRKKKSSKPQGFVDISVRISEEREDPTSHQGDLERFKLMEDSNGINLDDVYGHSHSQFQSQTTSQYTHPTPFPGNYSSTPAGTSYQPPKTPPPPPPPPPPSIAGYLPAFLPRTDHLQPSYINMPSSGPTAGPGHGIRPGFGMGLGAGAIAAGAVIFGDNFMSGLDLTRVPREPSLTISADPPF